MSNKIKLSLYNDLKDQIISRSHLLQVIIGPRQVGKTTTVMSLLETEFKDQYIYESADLVFNTSPDWLVEKWNLAVQNKKILVIDEIQKCENWSEVIKKLWDEAQRKSIKIQCILLGSSSLELQKGLTESLTGRFQLLKAFHWNFHESHEAYGLSFEEYLKFGGYPGSYPFKELKAWNNFVKTSILSTVIEKDILLFQNVKSPSLFRQAFEIIVSYPAQEISYTKLLGQIQDKGNVELVKYYISLYEGALLLKALEKYSEKKIKTKSSSPKILPLAPCMYFINILADYDADERGRVFELCVGAQLVRTGFDLYYWREGTYEVDFVLKVGKMLYAIEVKSGRKKSSKGMLAFSQRFKNVQPIYIDTENYFEFEKSPLEYLQSRRHVVLNTKS